MSRRASLVLLSGSSVLAAILVVVASAPTGASSTAAEHRPSMWTGRRLQEALNVSPVVRVDSPRIELTIPRLRAIAREAAIHSGDPRPTDVEALRTTHARAARVMPPRMPVSGIDNGPVFIITMNGNFTAYWASPPSGAPLPTGRHLTLIIDANTGQERDGGIEPYRPDLNRAGSPVLLIP